MITFKDMSQGDVELRLLGTFAFVRTNEYTGYAYIDGIRGDQLANRSGYVDTVLRSVYLRAPGIDRWVDEQLVQEIKMDAGISGFGSINDSALWMYSAPARQNKAGCPPHSTLFNRLGGKKSYSLRDVGVHEACEMLNSVIQGSIPSGGRMVTSELLLVKDRLFGPGMVEVGQVVGHEAGGARVRTKHPITLSALFNGGTDA